MKRMKKEGPRGENTFEKKTRSLSSFVGSLKFRVDPTGRPVFPGPIRSPSLEWNRLCQGPGSL
jgi:hypothetical protein